MGTRNSKHWGPSPLDLLKREWGLRVEFRGGCNELHNTINAASGGVCNFSLGFGSVTGGEANNMGFSYATEKDAMSHIPAMKAIKRVECIVLVDRRTIPYKETEVYRRPTEQKRKRKKS